MNKNEIIKYWTDISDSDYKTMLHLFESRDYHWSLFVGHLVIEKLLKALYVKNVGTEIPRTHDLLRLAEKSIKDLNETQKDMLDTVTTFNINARYPDYKQSFYKKCDYNFTFENIEKIKELNNWIRSIL